MEKEIQRWDDRGVVTPVARPPGIKTIKTRWVFDEKTDGMGELLKQRGRCVVKGFTQKLGEHYCTISTDRSHLVMRDAHSSLTLMFTTGGDA
jgi:hypothetical protein